MRALPALCLLSILAGSLPAQRPVSKKAAILDLTAAIVLEDMTVRSLPQFALDVKLTSDSTKTTLIRTDLTGHATRELPAGSYVVQSQQSATLGAHRYSWHVPVTLAAGQTSKLELTALNATVESVTVFVAQTARRPAPEVELYQRVRSGVVRVEAGAGHGSGWLVDTTPGLVVTNHHVIVGATYIAVQLDSITKVRGAVVTDDAKRDLAILRIAHDACNGCYRFRIATPQADGHVVTPGERVIAFGYPLNQETVVTMTLGIVSSLREKAIISDVNINHGNSGGPMVDLEGRVVGVNTFGDFTDQGGPGISGAILVSELQPLLQHALDTLASIREPPADHLPVMPLVAYPADKLLQFAQDDPKVREHYANINGGDFTVDLQTPASRYARHAWVAREVSRERRKREEEAGVTGSQRYRAGDEPEWTQYVGENQPVVVVLASPKIGETGGSKFLRAFTMAATGFGTKAKFVFKADLEDLKLFRDSLPVEPVARYRFPQQIYVNNQQVRMADVAYYIAYLYPSDAFAPDSGGKAPKITVGVLDLKHMDRGEKTVEVDEHVVTQIWADFAPWREALKSKP
jgi:S1-C subfamily serine protease